VKYFLDTNVCIDYLNGRYPDVVRRVQEAHPEDLCISSVVASELRYGAEKSHHKEANHKRLDILLQEIECRPFDEAAASTFGHVRCALESQGQPIGPYDMMIAAHALAEDYVLVTDNTCEFSRVPGLTLENWRET
jgi:tRNA(fMet)-specific endonuclease VapC